MQRELIVEIGFEELPALPLLKELDNITPKFQKALETHRLKFDFDFYYTPRRFIIHAKHFPTHQSDELIELFGPPLEAAFKDGEPTKAAVGFAKKCGVSPESLEQAEKNGKTVLYYQKTEKGKEAAPVLNEVLQAFIGSLNFGRSMRWRDRDESFIRPVKWLFAMCDAMLLDMTLFDAKSQNYTLGHMSDPGQKITVAATSEFFAKLEANNVVYDQNIRKEKVLEQIKAAQSKLGFTVDVDSELLDEVVAITEFPTALVGTIDTDFLRLPKEVIATSMKEHQRYFAVYNGEAIAPHFIVVSNGVCDDYSKIVQGNERVLRARLQDALFFYDNDLKNGLNPEALKNVTFMKELGSVYDKTGRETAVGKEIARPLLDRLAKELGGDAIKAEVVLEETLRYAKADLVSEMVYEFTELQGVMGGYYAKAAGMGDAVATAIAEQYLPIGENSLLPGTLLGSIAALSIKLETLLSLFSLGMIPSGNKDPYALRRAASGALRIIRNQEIPLDLEKLIKVLVQNYSDFKTADLKTFIAERLFSYYNTNPSIIHAVIASGETDILELMLKVEALDKVSKETSFSEDFSTFKRVANISKDIDLSGELPIDTTLFEKEEEKALFNVYEIAKHALSGGYEERLKKLFGLKKEIDGFFDNVMVNAEDVRIRENRKNLIGAIYKSFKEIADIKEISV